LDDVVLRTEMDFIGFRSSSQCNLRQHVTPCIENYDKMERVTSVAFHSNFLLFPTAKKLFAENRYGHAPWGNLDRKRNHRFTAGSQASSIGEKIATLLL
jgi:hypothetical protein